MTVIVYIHIPGIIFHSVSKNMWHENRLLAHVIHVMGTLFAQGAALVVVLILRTHVCPRCLAEPFVVSSLH